MKTTKNIKIKIKLRIKIIIILIIIIYFGFVIGEFLLDRLLVYAKQEAANKAINNINEIINDDFIKSLDFENIIDENKTFVNTISINKIIKEANKHLKDNINTNNVEKLFIPIKAIFSEMLYEKDGAGFYIKSLPVSSYETDIVISVDDFGLNNSVISVYLDVKINIEILFPLNKINDEVSSKLLLTMIIVEGKVPGGIIYSN